MKEISKEKLEEKIKSFEMKGWHAEVIGDFNHEEKMYVTEPEGWRRNEEYTNPKDYPNSSPKKREAIRFANLNKIHYKKFPHYWMESIY